MKVAEVELPDLKAESRYTSNKRFLPASVARKPLTNLSSLSDRSAADKYSESEPSFMQLVGSYDPGSTRQNTNYGDKCSCGCNVNDYFPAHTLHFSSLGARWRHVFLRVAGRSPGASVRPLLAAGKCFHNKKRTQEHSPKSFYYLVGAIGFEPTTF